MGLLLLLTLAGCMTQERFEKRYAASSCELFADCEVLDLQGFATHRECETTTDVTDECDDFDSKAAQACISGIEAMDCSALFAGSQPNACDRVCKD